MSTIITSLDPRSPAQRAGVRCGEKLIAINGHTVTDVLDYRFSAMIPVWSWCWRVRGDSGAPSG